jgi:hypothetical protein
MTENLRTPEEQPENEQVQEQILDALESAFEKGVEAELTVSEPSGELRISTVFVEGLEEGLLFVSLSKDSPVMGIPLKDIKQAKLIEELEK